MKKYKFLAPVEKSEPLNYWTNILTWATTGWSWEVTIPLNEACILPESLSQKQLLIYCPSISRWNVNYHSSCYLLCYFFTLYSLHLFTHTSVPSRDVNLQTQLQIQTTLEFKSATNWLHNVDLISRLENGNDIITPILKSVHIKWIMPLKCSPRCMALSKHLAIITHHYSYIRK